MLSISYTGQKKKENIECTSNYQIFRKISLMQLSGPFFFFWYLIKKMLEIEKHFSMFVLIVKSWLDYIFLRSASLFKFIHWIQCMECTSLKTNSVGLFLMQNLQKWEIFLNSCIDFHWIMFDDGRIWLKFLSYKSATRKIDKIFQNIYSRSTLKGHKWNKKQT